MLIVQIVFALLAYSPLAALAAPHSLQEADGTGHAISKNLANEFLPASTLYSGPWANFPGMSTWTSFDKMFNANQQSMFVAASTQQDGKSDLSAISNPSRRRIPFPEDRPICTGVAPYGLWASYLSTLDVAVRQAEKLTKTLQVDHIRLAVTSVAASYGVDARVLFGIIMEESHGGVGVATTYNADGLPTGGLMQASGCHGYDGQNNLAQADITYMVECGTQHFKTNLASWCGQNSEQTIYPALREFNSGSVVTSDLSTAPNGVGNPTYVSDIAQRLQGWTN